MEINKEKDKIIYEEKKKIIKSKLELNLPSFKDIFNSKSEDIKSQNVKLESESDFSTKNICKERIT